MVLKKRSSLAIMASVIFALVLREIRSRFGAKRFGVFWVLFEPVVHVLALVTFMMILRGRHIPGFDYPIFLITGIVPFLLMRNIALRTMEAVNANKALFAYKQITPFDTFVARTIVEFSLSACVYIILMAGLGFWFEYDISIAHPLEWFFALLVGVLFAFSLGLLLCMIVEIFPDIKIFFRMVFLPLYFLSGVVFPWWVQPPRLLHWMLWNPFFHIVDRLRESVFEYYPENREITIIYPAKLVFFLLFIALALYRGRRQKLVAI